MIDGSRLEEVKDVGLVDIRDEMIFEMSDAMDFFCHKEYNGSPKVWIGANYSKRELWKVKCDSPTLDIRAPSHNFPLSKHATSKFDLIPLEISASGYKCS